MRAVTGGKLPLEEIIELEHEALAEIGNIILNGCLATMANMLQRNLKMSLPEDILRGEPAIFFNLAPPPEAGEVVMFLYINFAIQERDIRGYIAMLMDMPSIAALQSCSTNSSSGQPEGTYSRMTVREPKLPDTLFDVVDVELILLDGEQRVAGWNGWMEHASRISEADARGRRLEEVFPDTPPRLRRAIQHALELRRVEPGHPLRFIRRCFHCARGRARR